MSRVEGLAVSGGFRHSAGASVSTLTTFPLPAHRTPRADFPHWALARDHALAHAKLHLPPSGVPTKIVRGVVCHIDPLRCRGFEPNCTVANRLGTRFNPVPAAVSVACCQWRSEHRFRRRYPPDGRIVAGGRDLGRCIRPRRSVPIKEVARATSTRRAVAGTVQLRLKTALAGEDYVKRKAWLDATAPPCPWHKKDCQLVPHGTYERRTPESACAPL